MFFSENLVSRKTPSQPFVGTLFWRHHWTISHFFGCNEDPCHLQFQTPNFNSSTELLFHSLSTVLQVIYLNSYCFSGLKTWPDLNNADFETWYSAHFFLNTDTKPTVPCSTPATESQWRGKQVASRHRESHLPSQALLAHSMKALGESLMYLDSGFHWSDELATLASHSCCHILMKNEEQKALKSIEGTAL